MPFVVKPHFSSKVKFICPCKQTVGLIFKSRIINAVVHLRVRFRCRLFWIDLKRAASLPHLPQVMLFSNHRDSFKDAVQPTHPSNLISVFLVRCLHSIIVTTCEPPHDKTNKTTVRPAKTQISLDIRPVGSVIAVRSISS